MVSACSSDAAVSTLWKRLPNHVALLHIPQDIDILNQLYLQEIKKMALQDTSSIAQLPVLLDRDKFLRRLLRELSGTLEEVVGLKEANGFISVVGQRIGEQINNDYLASLKSAKLSREQVAQVLVDLKRRIEGDFYIIEQTEDKIVLGNRACPFGDKVLDRPSLCMMTSNVFGVIASENLGYAKVEIQQAIARGDKECRVVVYLQRNGDSEAVEGREYFHD